MGTIRKPTRPRKPNKPKPPKKTVGMNRQVPLYRPSVQLADLRRLVESRYPEAKHLPDSAFLVKTIQEHRYCGGCKETPRRLVLEVNGRVPNPQLKVQLRGYNKRMAEYPEKIRKYEEALAEYEDQLREWKAQQKRRQLARLQTKAQKLKGEIQDLSEG